MPVNQDKFGAEEFLAMSNKANIGVAGQQMLHQWMLLKDLHILPSKCQLCGLGHDFLQPITDNSGKEKIYSYWSLPDIVKQSLLDNWQSNLTSFELHVSGDHGQGAFCMPLKFNFLFSDNSYSSYETLFLQIDCEQESYILFKRCWPHP